MIALNGSITLITGGSRGIGRATAVMFAGAGGHVAINYRSDKDAAKEVVTQCRAQSVRAAAFQADVADKDQVDEMVEDVVAEFGRIDCVINNAGVWINNPIDEITRERLQETIDINLMGTFYVCTAVIPHMKKQKSGNIINISSTAGQRGEAYYSPYAATKGGVISLTKSLAPELADYGIRVNCVAPGWVETDMSAEALKGEGSANIRSVIPLGRGGRPEELAGPILFMASDLSTFITGEILNVNGGAVLCG